ncbi:hypothetical protein [Gabonibacter massiliensis]|uniref:golvesin C-terminal-like domain-containing protein n=1 Tax=Gabonibacter massiliensis TaxID=1720195 RepID=UPI00073F0C1F|nr:hypothetical protein [Gabonibacter massiliensis]
MNTSVFFHVAEYEMKQQGRSWLFRFFALFSLIEIVLCHVYWQGQGVENWKMVALPCSMPLVNAYLYSVIQSLFLTVTMADIPRRLSRPGALESLQARPVDNTTFYWGIITGNGVLFLLINVVVILSSVFIVNLTSLAPVSWSCYLFYLLTLNLPSWLLVAGFSLWLSSVTGSRYLAIFFSLAWLIGCLFWLPYFQHGTFDYTGSGVPNLFSELVGHLNLPRYMLHRLAYSLIGLGLLAWSVSRFKRIPNYRSTRENQVLVGVLLLFVGLGSGFLLEYSHYRDRLVRSGYRASFDRNWREEICRVKKHDIRLRQTGRYLKAESNLLVYNPGKQTLGQITLFLNPGLEVLSVKSGDKELPYRRDQQVILIGQPLGVNETSPLYIAYEGMIDDRYCDLHLPDKDYETVFYNDKFFPTGRCGAFVENNFLLLTPASSWYPVSIPPSNPFMPLATGRDFTLFTLEVEKPLQKTVVSQGVPEKIKDGIRFTSHNPLNGISLYGANTLNYTTPVDSSFGFRFNLTSWGKDFARMFSRVSQRGFTSFWQSETIYYWYDYRRFPRMGWYEPRNPYLHFSEVPVSFRLSSGIGKPLVGLTEPGIVFFRERGFEFDLVDVMSGGVVRNGDDFFVKFKPLFFALFEGSCSSKESHPLRDIGQKWKEASYGDSRVMSLDDYWNIWIFSLKYPFIGKTFEVLQNRRPFLNTSSFSEQMFILDYPLKHTLEDILSDTELQESTRAVLLRDKVKELGIRLAIHVPSRVWRSCLDSLYRHGKGEIDYDSLIGVWSARWGVNVDSIVMAWMSAKHQQFFRVKDDRGYYDPVTKLAKVEGRVMNAGKTGGVVSIEHNLTGEIGNVEDFACYLEPGEAKEYSFVLRGRSAINTGLSANRPTGFIFSHNEVVNGTGFGEIGGQWRSISVEEFLAGENKNEFVVDDQDAGFELVDGNLTWFQKWFKKEPSLRRFQDGETSRWGLVITPDAEGDSIRGCYCTGGGEGKSTATWRVNLPEAGRYRVVAKVYKRSLVPGPILPGGVIYHYTVFYGDKKEEVEVNLDELLPRRIDIRGWASLGEYDFPAGEARVVLSDKDLQKRKDVAIVADAVKWIKIE